MTKDQFESIIIPFLNYYWEKTQYYNIGKLWDEQIRIGNMILHCSKSYIPDDIIIIDQEDNIIDGYYVCRNNKWNNEVIKDTLITLGVFEETEV